MQWGGGGGQRRLIPVQSQNQTIFRPCRTVPGTPKVRDHHLHALERLVGVIEERDRPT